MQESDIKKSANSRGVPIIRDTSHQILIEQIKKANPKQILEIGTAVGYSGIAILENCSGFLTTIDHDLKLVKEAEQNFEDAGLLGRVKIINDDCLVQIALMVADDKYNNYFDFIFLDGPKAQYQNMIEGLIMLLAPGGTILVDNVLFRGYVSGEVLPPTKRHKTIISRLKKFIQHFLSRDDLENAKLIEIDDGMLVAQKSQKTQN